MLGWRAAGTGLAGGRASGVATRSGVRAAGRSGVAGAAGLPVVRTPMGTTAGSGEAAGFPDSPAGLGALWTVGVAVRTGAVRPIGCLAVRGTGAAGVLGGRAARGTGAGGLPGCVTSGTAGGTGPECGRRATVGATPGRTASRFMSGGATGPGAAETTERGETRTGSVVGVFVFGVLAVRTHRPGGFARPCGSCPPDRQRTGRSSRAGESPRPESHRPGPPCGPFASGSARG